MDPLVHLVTAPIAAGGAGQKGEQKVLERLTRPAPAAMPPSLSAVLLTPSPAAARTKKRG